MKEGILYFFTKHDSVRPIEEQYVSEINGERKSFVQQEDAMLYLFDNGVKTFKRLTKEVRQYKDISKTPNYEFWHIEHRVGYMIYDYEPYVDENDNVKRRRAYVFRFVGFGRSCFAKTEEELKIKVINLIHQHKNDPIRPGYDSYPFYTRYYRYKVVQENKKSITSKTII